MIKMTQWPLEETRTPGNACYWQAECEVAGKYYSARSRHGAPNELARVLVTAGVPDQPVQTKRRGSDWVSMRYRSLHGMAKWTYEESASTPLHRVRWEDPAVKRARIGAAFGSKPGDLAVGGIRAPADVDAA